jgi:hypothetical protein
VKALLALKNADRALWTVDAEAACVLTASAKQNLWQVIFVRGDENEILQQMQP